MTCATHLLAKCFHSSRDDVQKKTAEIHLLVVTSPERRERSLTCILVHTMQSWCEKLGGSCCPLEVANYLRGWYVKPLAREYPQKSYTGCGWALSHPHGQWSFLVLKLCVEEEQGEGHRKLYVYFYALYLLGVVLNSSYFDSKSKIGFIRAGNTV